MKTEIKSFRSKEAKLAGVKAFVALYLPITPPETAALALEWMNFCDRTGRKSYENPA